METVAAIADLKFLKDLATGKLYAELDGNLEGPLTKAWAYNLVEQAREKYKSNPYVQVQASEASSAIGDL